MNLEAILYVKEALGQFGEPISVYKLRTMERDAERRRDEFKTNGRSEWGKFKDDSRITKIGRFLRRYWIDEVPQFYNILRGDMSLVGIRPANEEEWRDFPGDHRERALKYKPGLLGVHYSLPSHRIYFEDVIEIQEVYLNEKERHPILTDVKYFFKIWYNIIFRGVRSK